MARSAVLAGRTIADLTRNVFVVVLMMVVGFLVGFRIHTNVFALIGGGLLVLLFGFAMSWIFADGRPRGRRSRRPRRRRRSRCSRRWCSRPRRSCRSRRMPGWLQVFAEHQPVSRDRLGGAGPDARRSHRDLRVALDRLERGPDRDLRDDRGSPVSPRRLAAHGALAAARLRAGPDEQRTTSSEDPGDHGGSPGHADRAVLRPRLRLLPDPGDRAHGRRPHGARARARTLLVLACSGGAGWATRGSATSLHADEGIGRVGDVRRDGRDVRAGAVGAGSLRGPPRRARGSGRASRSPTSRCACCTWRSSGSSAGVDRGLRRAGAAVRAVGDRQHRAAARRLAARRHRRRPWRGSPRWSSTTSGRSSRARRAGG